MEPKSTAVAICEALGLDADKVCRLSFELLPHGMSTVTAELLLLDDRGQAIGSDMKRYRLVEQPASEEEDGA